MKTSKKKLAYLIILFSTVVYVFNSCQKEEITNNSKKDTSQINLRSTTATVGTIIADYTDHTGLLHVRVYKKNVTLVQSSYNIEVGVDTNFVVVGGGASSSILKTPTWKAGGLFLYESRPNTNLNSWIVSAKSHITSVSWPFSAYAIGLRIDGISASTLKNSYIQLIQQTSSISRQPSMSITAPDGTILLGGGCKVNFSGAGNLITKSQPNFQTWEVQSSDNITPDPSTITCYAIAMQKLTNIGSKYTIFSTQNIETSNYVLNNLGTSTSVELPFQYPMDWVITCPGGRSEFSTGNERLITSIFPGTNNDSKISSKDNQTMGSGTTFSSAMGIFLDFPLGAKAASIQKLRSRK